MACTGNTFEAARIMGTRKEHKRDRPRTGLQARVVPACGVFTLAMSVPRLDKHLAALSPYDLTRFTIASISM